MLRSPKLTCWDWVRLSPLRRLWFKALLCCQPCVYHAKWLVWLLFSCDRPHEWSSWVEEEEEATCWKVDFLPHPFILVSGFHSEISQVHFSLKKQRHVWSVERESTVCFYKAVSPVDHAGEALAPRPNFSFQKILNWLQILLASPYPQTVLSTRYIAPRALFILLLGSCWGPSESRKSSCCQSATAGTWLNAR